MWWRKRRQERKHQELIRSKTEQFVFLIQRRWADYFNAQERNWSIQRKKVYCILFCLIGGGTSIAIITGALFSPLHKKTTSSQEISISRPSLLPERKSLHWNKRDSLSVVQFRKWIDSTATSNGKRRILDSFFHAHKGFVDSFLELEATIFHSSKILK